MRSRPPPPATGSLGPACPRCRRCRCGDWAPVPPRAVIRLASLAEAAAPHPGSASLPSGRPLRQWLMSFGLYLTGQDFQFFDVPRLTEIYNKENAHEVHKHNLVQREASLRAQVLLQHLTSALTDQLVCILVVMRFTIAACMSILFAHVMSHTSGSCVLGCLQWLSKSAIVPASLALPADAVPGVCARCVRMPSQCHRAHQTRQWRRTWRPPTPTQSRCQRRRSLSATACSRCFSATPMCHQDSCILEPVLHTRVGSHIPVHVSQAAGQPVPTRHLHVTTLRHQLYSKHICC